MPSASLRRWRTPCLNGEIFCSLREAKVVIEHRRIHYNTRRPHSAPGYRPPAPRNQRPATRIRRSRKHAIVSHSTWYMKCRSGQDRFGDRNPLRNKDIDLPQLGGDLFRRVLLPCHVLILLDAMRHTSSRTTSMGVDQPRSRDQSLRSANHS